MTVADFSRVLAGPLCTMMLADAGARVIKVEEPSRGEETRRWGPPFIGEESAYFLSINRNKESLTLDLKSEQGRVMVRRLVRRSDVIVDNFLPSQRERVGLTASELQKFHPAGIYCSIVGSPSSGSNADRPGYDLLAQAAGGLMAVTGAAEGEPSKVGVAISDVLTAHHAHGAILAALFKRQRTGQGSVIEVSLMGSTVASLINVAQSHLLTGLEPRRWGNAHASIVPYEIFQAKDGPFALGVGTDRQFELLCREVICRDDLAADDRFKSNRDRVSNRETLVGALRASFLEGTAKDWVRRCRTFDIPAAEVASLGDLFESELGKSMVTEVMHPSLGPLRMVRSPVELDGRTLPVRSAPPTLGQHTDAILRELGMTPEEVEEMRSGGLA